MKKILVSLVWYLHFRNSSMPAIVGTKKPQMVEKSIETSFSKIGKCCRGFETSAEPLLIQYFPK